MAQLRAGAKWCVVLPKSDGLWVVASELLAKGRRPANFGGGYF